MKAIVMSLCEDLLSRPEMPIEFCVHLYSIHILYRQRDFFT